MRWISNLSSRYWRNAHFLLIIVLSLTIAFGPALLREFLGGATIATFYFPFHQVKSTVVRLNSVYEENERLGLELIDLRIQLSQSEQYRLENSRLRGILGFEPPPSYSLLPAKLLSVTGEPRPMSAVINRGSNDDLQTDLTLINEQGLVGRLVSVSSDVSIVQLLTDPTHRVAARVGGSREMGIVKFVADGLVLDNFPIQGSITQGDQVLTSGLGGVYPAGLQIGVVTSIERPEDEPFCVVRLEASVNFNSLEELFVLRSVIP